MARLTKIEEFVISETGVKVTILGDTDTMGKKYAEAHLRWPNINKNTLKVRTASSRTRNGKVA